MITVFEWVDPANDPPWFSSFEMRAAVIPDNTAVNANTPTQFDPDGSQIHQMIVDAYNRVEAPDPVAVVGDFEFVAPPEGYEWPITRGEA